MSLLRRIGRAGGGQPYLNAGVSYSSLPVTNRRALIAAALLACSVAAGCGGDDDDGANPAPPPAKAADFPKAAGKTLAELSRGLGRGGRCSPRRCPS